MIDICFDIFPQGSLDSSVTTTVWIGIFVIAFFNLRFGWCLSGLVIPGYLVPLLIVKPWSAFVVIVEAILCYWIVVWLFKYAPKFGLWNSAFGRDRFFVLLLVSVLIRLLLDGWLLAIIGEIVNQKLGITFDYQNHLYSFGLIIVALIANQFWKPGVRRGIVPLFVTIGFTYLIVRYGLMEYTNFSLSNLGYMYEDIASSMLTSPKAYIILLTTAFIASHLNLCYGWEYSGILIPSLLALLWYQPFKIAATFVETFVILGTAILILRLPMFKKATIEGARKILLFFNISYAYKFLLAYLILWLVPGEKISDYYGFGYLLPSLLAIKMFDKEIVVRITRTTIQTSFMSIILASAVGFSLTLLPELWSEPVPSDYQTRVEIIRLPYERLIDTIRKEKLSLYQHCLDNTPQSSPGGEHEIFSNGVRTLMKYTEQRTPELLMRAQWLLAKVHYRIKEIDNRYLYLYESEPYQNRGIYVINMTTSSRLLVEVPFPLSEGDIMEAGTWLFTMMDGKALAIAGSANLKAVDNYSSRILSSPGSFLHAFHKETAFRDVVQVRGYTSQSIRAFQRGRGQAAASELLPESSRLWVKSSLPPGLHLGKLQQLIGEFDIQWGRPPMKNMYRDITGSGFAELYLNTSAIRTLFLQPALDDRADQPREDRIDGYIQDWLFSIKPQIARKGSGKYVTPKQEELLFFDHEILTPLLDISGREYASGQWSQTGMEELRKIAAAAALVRYDIILYRDKISGQDYLILKEQENASLQRYWGTYVFRLGQMPGYIIQVPCPLFETYTLEYSIALFERLQARALLIGGAHKYSNQDGSADLTRPENIQNLFNLVNQVILRESESDTMLVIQPRALGAGYLVLGSRFLVPGSWHPASSTQHPAPGTQHPAPSTQHPAPSTQYPVPSTQYPAPSTQYPVPSPQPPAPYDVLLSFHHGGQNLEDLSLLGHTLLATLQTDGIRVRFVDGSPETAGYEASGTVQSLYLNETANKEFALLWLSPLLRSHYRQQSENRGHNVQFKTLGIPSLETSLSQHIVARASWETSEQVPHQLYEQIRHYIATHDIVALQSVVSRWPDYRFEHTLDLNTGQSFLLVYSPRSTLLLVANLFPRTFNEFRISDFGFRISPPGRGPLLRRGWGWVQSAINNPQFAEPVVRFIETRAAWLTYGVE